MTTEVNLPQYGMGMTEGTLIQWLKAEGDMVSEDEEIAEVEAEKTEVMVVAPVAGRLAKIVFTWRCCEPSHTDSFPDTASTEACSWLSNHIRSRRSSPYTLSPVTHVAGTPAAKVRASICRANWGVVAQHRSSGMPACWQRSRSSVHAWGR